MRNFVAKVGYISVFLISTSLSAQSSKKNICTEIYGTWETYYKQLPFRIISNDKSEIWTFRENGILIIDNKSGNFYMEDNCKKLYIDKDFDFFVEFDKDSLSIIKKILPHESYIIRLKKINRKWNKKLHL